MEVLIKKSKLTKSIVSQIQPAWLDQIEKYEPIGWVVDGKYKKVILAKEGYLAFLYMDCVVAEERDGNTEFCTQIQKYGFCSRIIKKGLTMNDAKSLSTKIRSVINLGQSIGQIFL